MAIVLDGNNLLTTGVLNNLQTQNTTSGSNIDFTGIPNGVKRVTVTCMSVSFAGASYGGLLRMQLGTSSAIATSGYAGAVSQNGPSGAGTALSAGFDVNTGWTADNNLWSGHLLLTLAVSSTNTWVCSGILGNHNYTYTVAIGGTVALSAPLSTVRLTNTTGSTFDNGAATVFYE